MKRALLLALVLTACSGGGAPSETDLRTALTAAGNRGGREAVKLACKPGVDRPGYVCDYRAPACNRYTGKCGSAKPFTGRFLDAGGRWQLVEDLTPRAVPDPVTQPLPGVAMTPVPTEGTLPTAVPTAEPAPPFESAPIDRTPAARPLPAPTIPPPPPPGGGYEEDDIRPRDLARIAEWNSLNARCRPGEWDACEDRDRLARRLERRGLCHTRAGWGRCD